MMENTTSMLPARGEPECTSHAVAAGPLRPCPFCGAEATLEPDPRLKESVRIACGNDACGVRPRTEPLLACYADELWAAWNRRAAWSS